MKGGMAAEPSFLCTFCWIPQLRPAKPKVLGCEARIACETCWKAVLNLSVCWVCGEIVVRGEEVVSLGWCFWHRSCFGCLLCGTGLDPPMEDKREGVELHSIDEDDSDYRNDPDSGYKDRLGRERTQRQRSVELVSIPLCAWCDNATDGLYDAQVLKIGLQNITKKDGGLSRSRLDIQRKTMFGDTTPLRQSIRTLAKGQRQVQNNEHKLNASADFFTGAGNLGVGEYGNADGVSNYSSSAKSIGLIPVSMYVSVLDVIGRPSFRASSTKPLPGWMTLLPSYWQPVFEQDGIVTLSHEAGISVHEPTSIVAEEPPDSDTLLYTTTTVPGLCSQEAMKHYRNTIRYNAVGMKEDEAAFEPAIWEDTEVSMLDDDTSWEHRAPHPQRSGTPYPFRRAVCPPFRA